MRTPLTFDDYASARMIREPLCMLDMDVPVAGADAFVLTSAERAKAMPRPPVLVHATATGMVGENSEDQLPSLRRHGQHVVVEPLKAKSDFWIDDVDVYLSLRRIHDHHRGVDRERGLVQAGRGHALPARALGGNGEPRPDRRSDPDQLARRLTVGGRHAQNDAYI
jgi:hypothetical protein